MAQTRRAARKHAESSHIHHAHLTRPSADSGPGRFRTARLTVAALLLLVLPLFAHAGIIYVDGGAGGNDDGTSWTDAYIDLQDALGEAESGDEIWVAAGVYKPTDGTDRTATFQLINGVEIYGGFDGTETTREERDPQGNVTVLSGDIDDNDTTDGDGVVVDADDIAGNNSFHVTTGSGTDATAVLDGFTITAGHADGGFPHDRGGGMINDGGSPTLTNLVFSGNFAIVGGGGMLNINSSSPTLTNVDFSGNSGGRFSFGGGMYNRNSSPTLTNVTFSDNFVTFEGGGMHNDDNSNPTLTDVNFSDNHSERRAGGMYNSRNSNPTLTNVTFSRNSCDELGGGMYNHNSSPTLTNVTFSGNSAVSGGGMSTGNGSPTLTNVTFSGNFAVQNGGGLIIGNDDSPTLTNVTFSGNRAGTRGGGIWNDDNSGILDIRNTIFWNNEDDSGTGTAVASIANLSGASPTISYSLVQGCNPGGTWNTNCGADGGNNLPDDDPLFVDTPDPTSAPTTAGDVRLLARSPAVDAGNDGFFSDIGTATDLDGKDRLFGDSVDLGPFETAYLSVSFSTAGTGTGSASVQSPLPARFDPGDNVTVEAVPAQSSVFDGWTGDLISADNPLDFTINTDTALTANFTLKTFEVTATTASGNGTIDPASQSVDYDGTASFTVTPDAGWSLTSVTGDTCSPVNTTGTTWEATNIQADCAVEANFAINSYNIGGTVAGLDGDGLELALNGGIEILLIAGNGAFQFSTELDHDTDYTVTVESQPTDPVQTCTIANATGTVNAADVNDIEVTCSTDTFTVGGTVTDLEGSGLVLQNNGGDDLAISANGEFTFATPLADGSNYEVSVLVQPDGQQCTVAQGTGTLAGDNVTSVEVDCATIQIGFDFSEIDFGNLLVAQSGSRTVTIRNDGDPDLIIDSFDLPESPFTFDPNSCAPLPRILAAGESCTVEVGFEPLRDGEFNDTLGVNSNASSSPDGVVLHGRASAIPVPALGPLGLMLLILLTGLVARPVLQPK